MDALDIFQKPEEFKNIKEYFCESLLLAALYFMFIFIICGVVLFFISHLQFTITFGVFVISGVGVYSRFRIWGIGLFIGFISGSIFYLLSLYLLPFIYILLAFVLISNIFFINFSRTNHVSIISLSLNSGLFGVIINIVFFSLVLILNESLFLVGEFIISNILIALFVSSLMIATRDLKSNHLELEMYKDINQSRKKGLTTLTNSIFKLHLLRNLNSKL